MASSPATRPPRPTTGCRATRGSSWPAPSGWCSALALNGRVDEARSLFDRLLALSNDLGLLAEEYDVARERQVGNFPQSFSHLTLILAADAISDAEPDTDAVPAGSRGRVTEGLFERRKQR